MIQFSPNDCYELIKRATHDIPDRLIKTLGVHKKNERQKTRNVLTGLWAVLQLLMSKAKQDVKLKISGKKFQAMKYCIQEDAVILISFVERHIDLMTLFSLAGDLVGDLVFSRVSCLTFLKLFRS